MQTMTPSFKDIPYAVVDGKRLLLDLYLPEAVSDPCLVAWLHGGAWQFGSKNDVRTDLIKAGYAMASVDFPKCFGPRNPTTPSPRATPLACSVTAPSR